MSWEILCLLDAKNDYGNQWNQCGWNKIDLGNRLLL
jgi:hypothetical protein